MPPASARVGTITLRLLVPQPLEPNRRRALLAVVDHCTVHNSLRTPPEVRITLGEPADSHLSPLATVGQWASVHGGQVMQLDEGTTSDIPARLRRIQGQVGGIIGMVESGRQCREVVQQISAAGRALDQTGFKILARACATACKTSRPPSRPATAKPS